MSEQLFDPSQYRSLKLADFSGIPDRVWPTPVYVLEQGGDLLIYRNADAARGMTRKQHEIFHLLARLGAHPDAPGSVRVLVCTGSSGLTVRQMAVFDHMHNDEQLRLAQPGEIERYIGDWFKERGGRR